MTARFFEFINGDWVKLSLKPDQSFSWYSRQPTEEGWSAEFITWEYGTDENGMPCVLRDWGSEGRDCDGKHGDYGQDSCLLENLQARERDNGPHTPTWGKASRRAFDQFAELSGY